MIAARTIYKEGANKGVYFGFYLIALFLCMVMSEKENLMSLPALLLLIGIPVFIYKVVSKVHRKYFRAGDFASLWMLGITVFIGGSLICAICTYAYLQYADPEFIERQAENALAIYKDADGFKDSDFIKVLQTAIDNDMLPSPIEVAVELLWMTTFFGSLLSMLIAAIVKARFPQQFRQ